MGVLTPHTRCPRWPARSVLVAMLLGACTPGDPPTSDAAGFPFVLPDAAAGPDGSGPGAGDRTCGFQRFELERLPADVVLLLDRSSSMLATLPGGRTRWQETTAALDEVLSEGVGDIRWGLKAFPTTLGCTVSGGIDVPVQKGADPVREALAKLEPASDGATPTAAAIRAAVSHFAMLPSRGPKAMVLATDGEPTCPGSSAAQVAVDAVTEAKAAGYDTFVVGIATAGTGADETLDAMAVAGGEPRAGAPKYLPVGSKGELVAALALVTSRVTNCTFALERDAPSPDDVAVNVGGTRLPRDRARSNGWDWGPTGKAIQIYGPVCDQLKMGDRRTVEVLFGCPDVPIP